MATITIKNLIGGSINIITGSAERWVPACNLDGSPLTDTDHAKWVFSDGGGYNLKYIINEEGGWDAWCGDQGNGAYMTFGETIGQPGATFINLDGFAPTYGVSAYRAYIPGHWEDANGNSINGSWDSETSMTKLFDDGVTSNSSCTWVLSQSLVGILEADIYQVQALEIKTLVSSMIHCGQFSIKPQVGGAFGQTQSLLQLLDNIFQLSNIKISHISGRFFNQHLINLCKLHPTQLPITVTIQTIQ